MLKKNNRPQSKLDLKWESCPYEIIQEPESTVAVYQIRKLDGTQLQWIHRNQLKPYPDQDPIAQDSEDEEGNGQTDSNDNVPRMLQSPLELLLSVGWPMLPPTVGPEHNDSGPLLQHPQG